MFKNLQFSYLGTLGQLFILIGICTMVQFSYSFMGPFLQSSFNLNKQELGLLAATSSGGTLIFSFVSGIWVDRVGFLKAMFVGTGLIGGAALLFIWAPHFYVLLLLTFIIGIGYSIILPLTNKRVACLFPAGRYAFAIGLKQSGGSLGIAAGSAFLPLLAVHWGWKISYLAMFVFVLAVVLLIAVWDVFFSSGKEERTGAIAGYEREAAALSLLPVAGSTLILISNILVGMAFSMTQVIVLTFLVPYYHERLGVDIVKAAAMLGVVQLAGAVARPGLGWVADCLVERKRAVLGVLGLCNAVVLGTLSLLNSNPNWLALLILSFVIGVSTLGWFGLVHSLMIDLMGPGRAGRASGLVSAFNLLGMTVASPFFGYLYERLGSYQQPLWFFVLFMFLASLFFLCIRSKERVKLQ